MEYYLYHSGTKGMEWGKRLYQNKDGSLTPLGKIRYAKQKKERAKNLEKARVAKAEKKAAAEKRAEDLEKGRIPIKKMTDAEIKARISRLELEKSLRSLENETGRVVISKGKRFINKFTDSTLDKVAENVGADLIAQALKAKIASSYNAKKGADIIFANNKKKS